jgi:hypothetical protein
VIGSYPGKSSKVIGHKASARWRILPHWLHPGHDTFDGSETDRHYERLQYQAVGHWRVDADAGVKRRVSERASKQTLVSEGRMNSLK